jgi:parallel beta-helix repeat protein
MELLANQIKGARRREHSFALRMLTAFSLVSTLMLAMGSLAQAAEVIEIGCGTRIEQSGHYRLAVDCVLAASDEVGISIGAVDVELDLDGHIISGPGCFESKSDMPTGIVVQTKSSRVRVANGTLKQLAFGIRVFSSDHSDFNKLTLVENCLGIELRDSSENNVSYNDISRNISFGVNVHGIATSSNNNHVTFNVIDQNGSPPGESGLGGVILNGPTGSPERAEGNIIAFNAFSRNLQNGVILSVARNNIVTSNVITQTSAAGTPGDGIGIVVGQTSTDNFLVGNIALGNETRDLDDENPNCDHNKWKDNTFRTSNQPSCIH